MMDDRNVPPNELQKAEQAAAPIHDPAADTRLVPAAIGIDNTAPISF